jgi:hypothetical protein
MVTARREKLSMMSHCVSPQGETCAHGLLTTPGSDATHHRARHPAPYPIWGAHAEKYFAPAGPSGGGRPYCAAPALRDTIGEFASDRIEQKNKAYRKHYKTLIETPVSSVSVATLYRHALQSLYDVLKQDFSSVERIPVQATSDFLQLLSSENEIEDRANAFY